MSTIHTFPCHEAIHFSHTGQHSECWLFVSSLLFWWLPVEVGVSRSEDLCIPIFLRRRTGQHLATCFFPKNPTQNIPKGYLQGRPGPYVTMNGVTKTAPFFERPKIHTSRYFSVGPNGVLYFDVIFPYKHPSVKWPKVDGKSWVFVFTPKSVEFWAPSYNWFSRAHLGKVYSK